MCDRVNDVMKLCCELSAHHQIRATVKGSSKGAAAAGGLAFAGGIIGGPLGIAVGKWEIYKTKLCVFFNIDQIACSS